MNKKEESFFNMWRAIVAMANIDNIISQEERGFINDFLKKDLIAQEQKQILLNDLKLKCYHPRDFIDNINQASHLSQLNHLATILFCLDGLDKKEEAYAKEITKYIETKVDILGASRLFHDNNALYAAQQSKRKSNIKDILVDFTEKYF